MSLFCILEPIHAFTPGYHTYLQVKDLNNKRKEGWTERMREKKRMKDSCGWRKGTVEIHR